MFYSLVSRDALGEPLLDLLGLLVHFFDVGALAQRVIDCLAHPGRYAPLRSAARQTALERYDLATICLPQQVRLIEELAQR